MPQQQPLRFVQTNLSRSRVAPKIIAARSGEDPVVSYACEGGLAGATHVVTDLELLGDVGVVLMLGFVPRAEEKAAIHVRYGLLPNVRTRVAFPVSALDGQTLFLPRTPLLLKGTVQGRRIDPAEVERMIVSLVRPREGVRVRVHAQPHATSRVPRAKRVNKVLVDPFGQSATRKWPGKVKNERELVERLSRQFLDAEGVRGGEGLSRFGGSTEHRFDATGRFRTQYDGKRWWLVDPDGHAFWSAGVDCVRCDTEGPIMPGTRHHYAWVPPARGRFADAIIAGRRTGLPSPRFTVANLIRAFDANWYEVWQRLATDVLSRHGFNTVANWSDLAYARDSGLPYVVPMPTLVVPGVRLFRSLPDVFAPAFGRACKAWSKWLKDYADNERLIGYFITNEPEWAFGKHNLASEMLEANPRTHTRRAFVAYLKETYRNDADAFARAWRMEGKTFATIERDIHRRAETNSEKAAADTWAFSARIVRRWMEGMSSACRAIAPGHLNLGVRWAWISSDLCYEVADYCDVFTINNYSAEPPLEQLTEISNRTKRPVMIGEFHHGATDRGLPSSGIQAVTSTRERGVAYRRYVELCAAHRACVGTHYFQYADQPYMGRFDGENYNIGLVDVCHTPYTELLDAAAQTHARLYDVASGAIAPTKTRATPVPPIFF